MSNQIDNQKEFVKKVNDLSSALIEYKSTKDESARYYSQITSLNEKSNRTYDIILTLKRDVLKRGLALGLTEEMVIAMVIDMTRSQLKDSYVRKLFSGDFSRGFLLKKSVASSNDGRKDIVQHSRTLPVPTNSAISDSIIPATTESIEDVMIV